MKSLFKSVVVVVLLLLAQSASAQDQILRGRIVDELGQPLSAANHGAAVVVWRIRAPYLPEYVYATDCWNSRACPDADGRFELNIDQYGNPLQPNDRYQAFAYSWFGLGDWRLMVANKSQKFVVAIDPVIVFEGGTDCAIDNGWAACTITVVRKRESWESNPVMVPVTVFGYLTGPCVTCIETVVPFSSERIELWDGSETRIIYAPVSNGAPAGMGYKARVFAGSTRWNVSYNIEVERVKP